LLPLLRLAQAMKKWFADLFASVDDDLAEDDGTNATND
jgi:hypothetical protein